MLAVKKPRNLHTALDCLSAMILETFPEIGQLTLDEKMRLSLELVEDVVKETQDDPELLRRLNAQWAAYENETVEQQDEKEQSLQSPSSKEFLDAVEKSIGAPVTTIRVQLRK